MRPVPEDAIATIRAAGYRPLAYSVMLCEDVFYFSTYDEALMAYQDLELRQGLVGGFWYALDDYERNREWYKNNIGSDLEIIML